MILGAAFGAYATWFVPGAQLRAGVRALAGYPSYAGPWIVAEHALLYTTLTATVCVGVWWRLARRGLLESPGSSFRVHEAASTLGWGVGIGLAISAFDMLLAVIASAIGMMPDKLGWHSMSGWEEAGQLFSNLYEEVIYRGFLLVAVRAVVRSRATAVIATSLLFGLVHAQDPIEQRAVIAIGGALMAVAYLRTRSLWAAWLSHAVSDTVLGLTLG